MNKKELTELFLKEANIPLTAENIKKYTWQWWYNPISKTSFRLTQAGHIFLQNELELQNYKLKLKTNIKATTKTFLLIDKYLSSPFFIENAKLIVFYGERDTLMVTLNGYDLQQYLENFER